MPYLETRIFLECRPAGSGSSPFGHLYLVRRDVLVDDNGIVISNELRPSDQVIGGQSGGDGNLDVETGNIAGQSDEYYSGDTPATRHSLDITFAVLASGRFANVIDAFDQMTYFGNALVDNYGYEFPDFSAGAASHLANSNATIFSVLNHADVDFRTLPTAEGGGSYADYFAGDFPGASPSASPTILGISGETDIEASSDLTEGVSLLGRDGLGDTLIGTRFADKFFGEQDHAAQNQKVDTVSYENSDSGLDFVLQAQKIEVGTSEHDGFVAQAGTGPAQGDQFLGIEAFELTPFADNVTIGADEEAVVTVRMDGGDSDDSFAIERKNTVLAGGEGDDTFEITSGLTGPMVLWGGEGSDLFSFFGSLTVYCVTMENCTIDQVMSIDIDKLPHADIFIVNPEQDDQLQWNGTLLTGASYTLVDAHGGDQVFRDSNGNIIHEFHDFSSYYGIKANGITYEPENGYDSTRMSIRSDAGDQLNFEGILNHDLGISIVGNGPSYTTTYRETTYIGSQIDHQTSGTYIGELVVDPAFLAATTRPSLNADGISLGGPNGEPIGGTQGDDTLSGGAEGDRLGGGAGSDTYLFSPGGGSDAIEEEAGSGDIDRLVIGPGVDPSAVSLERTVDNPDDLILTLNAQDSITLKNQFFGSADGGYGVEQIEFANGAVWTKGQLAGLYLDAASTGGADTIIGFGSNDALQGGAGDDYLAGGLGSDTFAFNPGDGHDLILEDFGYGDTDRLVLGTGFDSTSVMIERSLERPYDAVLVFASGDRVTLVDEFYDYGYDPESGVGIEEISFADGVVWTKDDIAAAYLAGASTGGDDLVIGYDGDDEVLGGAGNDWLSDTYGSNHLDGGDGIDTAAGYVGETTFTFDGGQWVVEDDYRIDRLTNVERVDLGGLPYLLVGNGGYADLDAAYAAGQTGDLVLYLDENGGVASTRIPTDDGLLV